MEQKKICLGKRRFIQEGTEMADEFFNLASSDEYAAKRLCENRCYNQAAYFYIQSMEKYIKGYICQKINVTNETYAQMLRELKHSLDETVDLLVKIISGNEEGLKQQIEYQLKAVILRNVNFSVMHNAVRYPYYYGKRQQYSITDIGSEDCKVLEEIYGSLKNYLRQLSIRL